MNSDVQSDIVAAPQKTRRSYRRIVFFVGCAVVAFAAGTLVRIQRDRLDTHVRELTRVWLKAVAAERRGEITPAEAGQVGDDVLIDTAVNAPDSDTRAKAFETLVRPIMHKGQGRLEILPIADPDVQAFAGVNREARNARTSICVIHFDGLGERERSVLERLMNVNGEHRAFAGHTTGTMFVFLFAD